MRLLFSGVTMVVNYERRVIYKSSTIGFMLDLTNRPHTNESREGASKRASTSLSQMRTQASKQALACLRASNKDNRQARDGLRATHW